jgi:hypothetical protein
MAAMGVTHSYFLLYCGDLKVLLEDQRRSYYHGVDAAIAGVRIEVSARGRFSVS